MKKIMLATVAIMAISCQSTDSKFLITDHSVGAFPKDSLVGALERIYKDFEVQHPSEKNNAQAISEAVITITEKNEAQTPLLSITPQKNDNQKIATIEVLDERFKTKKNISLNSTFADIKKTYSELDIETSFSSVVIMPRNTNIYFTIAKSELPPSATGDFSVAEIPDTTKITKLLINWQ